MIILGFPFTSTFDNKVHIFHGALDLSNYNAIQKQVFPDPTYQHMPFDYDQVVSRDYQRFYMGVIDEFIQAQDVLYGNLKSVFSYDEIRNLRNAFGVHSTVEYLEKMKTSIFPLLFIHFEK